MYLDNKYLLLLLSFNSLIVGCSFPHIEEEKYAINDNAYIGKFLRRVSNSVDPLDQDTRLLAAKLIDAANSGKNAVGLAAPQIGINKSVFVYRVPVVKEAAVDFPDLWTIAINPSYEPVGKKVELMAEGCFSVPHFYSKSVPRYKKIKYSYFQLDGIKVEGIAEGLKGQIIQHETDHLNGILFIDKLSSFGDLSKRPVQNETNND